jgi:hypothetical protein
LVGKYEGKRTRERPKHRWDNNIRMDLRETMWEGVDWMHLDQGRDYKQALENMAINLQVPYKVLNFLIS